MHTGKSMGNKSILLGIIMGLFFSCLGLLYYNNTNNCFDNKKHAYKHNHKSNYKHNDKKKNDDLTDYYFYRNIVPIYPQ